jgi:transcriptional regulator with XRE-family HTH domain
MESIKEIVCRNCKRLLDNSDLKLNEIERRMGVSGSTVQRWKSGIHAPELDKIDKLAKILNVSRDEFFATTEKVSVEISVVEAIRRFQSIPPDIYERAVKLGPSHISWEEVRVVLDHAIKEDHDSPSGGAGALA